MTRQDAAESAVPPSSTAGAEPGGRDNNAGQTRWLDDEQQRAWRGLLLGTTLLFDRLDADLRQAFDVSMAEYEILVRLSEYPDRRMRMSRLADALAHSRSRVTHTVARMQRAGLVDRSEASDDGRGIYASLTEHGYAVLVEAAHLHVRGVRDHLVDIGSPEDFAAMGRHLNAVADQLIGGHPEMEIR
ncbi:MAG: MarR family winged helix-turn-helix transcriptional regulator [Nocardioides sp.]